MLFRNLNQQSLTNRGIKQDIHRTWESKKVIVLGPRVVIPKLFAKKFFFES